MCDCPTFVLRGKYNSYEPLCAPISEIIKDIQVAKLMQFPLYKKRKFPQLIKPNIANFIGSMVTTLTTIKLKDNSESLITKGKLMKYRHYGDQWAKGKQQ